VEQITGQGLKSQNMIHLSPDIGKIEIENKDNTLPKKKRTLISGKDAIDRSKYERRYV
jgi:hypothetical protein